MQLLINKFPLGEPVWPIPKNNLCLQNTKNHLSVKLNSHKNKMWICTDYNIAPLLSVLSFSVPIVVFMSAVLKDF